MGNLSKTIPRDQRERKERERERGGGGNNKKSCQFFVKIKTLGIAFTILFLHHKYFKTVILWKRIIFVP
jgi:hypothetical protein